MGNPTNAIASKYNVPNCGTFVKLYILPFLHRLVLRDEFILEMERFKFDRTMFAKLFDVKASLSSKVIAQNTNFTL